MKKLFLICAFFFSPFVLAEETLLNDAFIQKQVLAFEQAYSNRQTVFFADIFSEDATITIHSKQRNNKHAIQYSRDEILQGELFKHPNHLSHLQRQDETIQYYNDKTQALLRYKMKPKPGSDFGGESGFLVDTEILFQLMKGEPKIVSVITHIDFEPDY